MPISAFDDYSSEHWAEVKSIIVESVASISTPRFDTRLVSDADEIGVIHKRIVQGVYSSDIIICDVSGKNANVMFELGMRLAFDKPTIIIKDDNTNYSFDTSIIEHLSYPKDLRFGKIVEFKKLLAQKVLSTYQASLNENYSTFLKNFGTFKVATLDEKEVSESQVVIDLLGEMQREIAHLGRVANPQRAKYNRLASPIDDAILEALRQLKLQQPNFNVDTSDETISALLKLNERLLVKYSTRDSFASALQHAVDVYNILG